MKIRKAAKSVMTTMGRVRRPAWPERAWLEIMWDGALVIRFNDETRRLTYEDILADDWKMVE